MLRTDKAEANAQFIAEKLSTDPRVESVLYVGLKADPGYALHASQATGAGAVVCFVPRGTAEQADTICEQTYLWTYATSLGGVDSTFSRH
jgi:cystathionine gamma-synthase